MTAVFLVVLQYAESAKDTAVVIEPLTLLISALRALANIRVALAAENLALRQQSAAYQRTSKVALFIGSSPVDESIRWCSNVQLLESQRRGEWLISSGLST